MEKVLDRKDKNPNNVVSMSKWKEGEDLRKEAESYRRYLLTLGRDGLLAEADQFAKELLACDIQQAHIKRGKMILGELSDRISPESNELSGAVKILKESLANRMYALNRKPRLDC